MIDAAERDGWARRFGVGTTQVVRDHLVSHLLWGLRELNLEGTVFYGGTALCRTFLEGSRLSEDIDLLDPEPPAISQRLAEGLPRVLRREFPALTLEAGSTRALASNGLFRAGDLVVRLEVIDPDTNAAIWQYEETDVQLRYSDLPSTVRLTSPTAPTFAAMKGLAWHDRHAPRDLYDLAGLARLGAIATEAEAMLRRAAGHGFIRAEFLKVPEATRAAWFTELAHQVGDPGEPDACAQVVTEALDQLSPGDK